MISFQSYVQHADGKVGVLAVAHAGAAATVAAQAGGVARLAHAGLVAGNALLGLFLLGFLVSGYHMLQTIRPVLWPPNTRSRYGITGVAGHLPQAADEDVATRIDEAWAMTRLLAQIAERKYRHVSSALPWTGLTLVAAISLTVLVAAWR
ncbi:MULTISPECIES: hypothetical protein [unclassified Streptosporangium]|uniref:hypothetical protein n=1 Tax=unclassified Streptosporangium TaxID=2632669 RepID=UPI002E294339|nr:MULTISPECIES: hypothetical protein [unclassified Streptosporangium]